MTKPSWTILLGTRSVSITESLIDTFKRFKVLEMGWTQKVDESNFVIKKAVMEIAENELQSQSN